MSDSDISRIFLRTPQPQNTHSERASDVNYSSVKIISLPERIRENHEDRISGKVLRHDKDNNLVVIRTPKGDIVLKTEKDFPIQDGDSVELKLSSSQTQNTYMRVAAKNSPAVTPSYTPIDKIITSGLLPNSIPQIKIQTSIEILPLTSTQIKNIKPITQQTLLNSNLPIIGYQNIAIFFSSSADSDLFVFPNMKPTSAEMILGQSTDFSLSLPLDYLHYERFSLQALPFKNVIAKLIKTNPDQLLTSHPEVFPIPAQSLAFKDGFLQSISPPQDNEYFHITGDVLPVHAKAGEIEIKLIGSTAEMGYPVFELPSHQEERLIVALNGTLDFVQEKSAFVITPTIDTTLTPSLSALPSFLQPILFSPPQMWDSLDEIFQTFQAHAPLQAQAMTSLIPSSASPMRAAHGALFFIAALRSGDLQSWMGEKSIDTIRRAGKLDTLQKFLKETTDISSLSDSPSEWKSTAVPYLHDQHIYRIHVHSRKEYPTQDQEEKKGGTTRFIIDLSLSKIGKVQLDGLFQGNEQQNIGRLDLIVRTQNSFSKASQSEMRGLYSNALSETNFTGELAFQNDPDQWVNISPLHTLERFSENI